jgi:CMP-N-acetylneuraminic acid synthetase
LAKIALIPARGGSKRLPRKNIMDFRGQPMISYTIEAAKESNCFDRVVVSTEDAEIADIAHRLGADIDQRPVALASDETRVAEVCVEFLGREAHAGRVWSVMACLYATAPMRNADDIRATVGLLAQDRCNFAMAVSQYPLAPHQALVMEPGGLLSPMWPDLVDRRASELPPLVVDNGSTYAVEVAAFSQCKTFYGPGLAGYEMSRARSIDIDTWEDYEFALWMAGRADVHIGAPSGQNT